MALFSETSWTKQPPPGPVLVRTSPCTSSIRVASLIVPFAIWYFSISCASFGSLSPGFRRSSITNALIDSATSIGRLNPFLFLFAILFDREVTSDIAFS